MRHAAPLRAVLAQDRREIGVRVALVKEHGLAHPGCELELPLEGLALRGARREVPEVIQPAFTDRHHLGLPGKVLELGRARRSQLARMMRVNAGGGKQSCRMSACQRQRTLRTRERRAGDHHLHNARRLCAGDHRVAVGVVAVVGEIDTDIDQRSERG